VTINNLNLKIINDFCITICSVNGSGSVTANNIILKALFKMGIPVSAKNNFPSNIQGLPTWYSIRVNKKGFVGRVEYDNIIVAMNPNTIESDVTFLSKNGVLLYDDQIPLPKLDANKILYPLPIEKILSESQTPANLKTYLANMVYVGILAWLLGIDLLIIGELLSQHFKDKTIALDINQKIIQTSFSWAKENLAKKDRYFVESMDSTRGFILSDGNTAAALGSIYGGVQFIAWYPITPATSLPESLNEFLPILRKDAKTGKNTFVSLQAEDELAAIGMVVGAGWSGLRAMTATSGPGLCLMSEYLGLAYLSEIPLVVWDVQRVGPSTGLPTHTSQGDLAFSYFLSHGDTDFIILLPGSVNECFEFGWKALDLAEELQTPVVVLSDLDLGMNEWMTPAFKYPDRPIQRGKILWEEDLNKLLRRQKNDWGRYQDVDGDGVPYRTAPGNLHPKAPYFTRGTGHDEYAHYSESPEVWERIHLRLKKKIQNSKYMIPKPELIIQHNSRIGIISFGSNDPAVIEACYLLSKVSINCDYLRIRALPFTEDIPKFLDKYERIYVVEANRDGQMALLIKMNYSEYGIKIESLAHMDGLSLSAEWIFNKILTIENKK
jgi:2-oxoglutarate ferredoxin oxidoreductase subunit alpha